MAYFIAIVPQKLRSNTELKSLLGKMKRTFRDQDKSLKWVPPEMWHMTLLYLGELSGLTLVEVQTALSSWNPNPAKLEIEVQGTGAFPDTIKARVLWLGVKSTQELNSFRESLVEYLSKRNIQYASEDHPFAPHITLARSRSFQSFRELIGLGGRKHMGHYAVTEVILFKTVIENSIPKYVPVLSRMI